MFMMSGRMRISKNYIKLFIIIIIITTFCCSCQWNLYSEEISYDFSKNYMDYMDIFAEQEAKAETITKENEQYLQLTFPDKSRALYKESLECIECDLEREEEDGIRSAELVITIDEKDEIAKVIIWIGEDQEGITGGSTGGEFVLPDFSEMLPDRSARADDVSILLSIERWISREQMSALYQRAKDIEYKMISVEENRMTEEGEG